MNVLRVYIETSAAGGYHDDGFKESTQPLFKFCMDGICKAEISTLVIEELDAGAPAHVKANLLTLGCEPHPITDEMERLTAKYLERGIVSENFRTDAKHIAAATVMGVDVLASWNFKHIVNSRRIKLFNKVNLQEGYGVPVIQTPRDIIAGIEPPGWQPLIAREETVPYMAGERKPFHCVGFKHELQDVLWEKIKGMEEAERNKYWGCVDAAYFRAMGEMTQEQGWPEMDRKHTYLLVRTAEEYIDELMAEFKAKEYAKSEECRKAILDKMIYG
jgi:hypothetical protein